MTYLPSLLLGLTLVPVMSQAAELTQLTLPNGRLVQLHDDFTWQYVVVKPAEQISTEVKTGNGDAAVVLTAQAKADPDLLSQAARDGVQVKLANMAGHESLTLTFLVSNSSKRNVVGITGWITLFSPEGVQLLRQEARFWVAENRLPETYLRHGQQRPSLAIVVPRPAGLTGNPLVRVEIDEVRFR
ncbi:DUF3157 family protein [Aeromonas cavernicola]|uniref:DUF3157 domain-containing protein n=1 Tax=Aeromonas cavernicola TaxID=1006623 RepID=A0A2H9U2Q4_9GAMM|nr:DUF3157 family protein [Aeromonas cavernicola]PJG58294.1 DUF3157 domain-containing protein [Aeromonas cavernicola]